MWEEAEEAGRNALQLGPLLALGQANLFGVLGPAKDCAGVSARSPTQPRSPVQARCHFKDSLSAKSLPFLGMQSRKVRHTVGVQ